MKSDDRENIRQKRAIYRAEHRGTKEMDWLLGRYVRQSSEGFEGRALDELEALLEVADRELEGWIMGKDDDIKPEFEMLVAQIKKFHKI